LDINRAKDYFAAGIVTGACARAPDGLHAGWTVEFSGAPGNWHPVLETARGKHREFRTLDATAKAIREVGFKQWSVITD
jgi:hypothetical protein